MGFREELEEILDATPQGRRTLLVLGDDAEADRRTRPALSARRAAPFPPSAPIAAMAISPIRRSRSRRRTSRMRTVNLLRLHEPDTAILFCATRDAVRRLHASLVERGFAAVALSGEHSQSERNHALQALRDRRARVCVATDVAARGIDLPVAVARRPCRVAARCRGAAAPFGPHRPRGQEGRRRPDRALSCAAAASKRCCATRKIQAEWIDLPTQEVIAAADRKRLLVTLQRAGRAGRRGYARSAPICSPNAIRLRSRRCWCARTARKLPAAEELLEGGAAASGASRRPASRFRGYQSGSAINIGRRNNADPRWLLPLLCRRGHITKQDVGAIRIGTDETRFQIPRAAAVAFPVRAQADRERGRRRCADHPVRSAPAWRWWRRSWRPAPRWPGRRSSGRPAFPAAPDPARRAHASSPTPLIGLGR